MFRMFRLDVSISLMRKSSRTQDRPPKNKISKLPSLSHIIFLHPPPSFHFSMIRGENFANSIANRMSVMPPCLNPSGVFRLYLFF